MKLEKMKTLVSAALFSAIICVATYIVQIPMPATGGYVNLGDCFVLTAGMMLGAGYGALAAGLGSALADMLAGYMQYAPATFVIKALMAIAAFYIFGALKKAFDGKYNIVSKIVAAVSAEAIMVMGYFGYEAVILGYGVAAAGSILGNTIQGAVGAAAAIALVTALEKASSKSKTLSSFFKAG
ncbi:MAG: ECF transporter S component [Clostridia bacterium]|nr:ECF transporter S component [Clostridia bacterium]